MKTKIVPSSWLREGGIRLDSGPYVSGAIEARALVGKLRCSKLPLHSVTDGEDAGIFNGPRFGRQYVDDPAYGVPFVGSTEVLAADLRYLPMLSFRQVGRMPALRLGEGWTLITCSGTVGRTAYCRSEMAGIAGSQHFMRVVPDASQVLPVYLYAYLAGRFGLPQLGAGTHGSIIEHIEPADIRDIPVPIAPEDVQRRAHGLVSEAAKLRSDASVRLRQSVLELEELMGLPQLAPAHELPKPDVSSVSSVLIAARLDALFHSNYHRSAVSPLLGLHEDSRCQVGDLAESIIEPARFKRIPLDDPEYGVPFFGTSDLMFSDPKPSYYLPRSMPQARACMVDAQTVLIPRSGQLNGIIGHPVLTFGPLLDAAVTEDAIRVRASSRPVAGYLFVSLSSEYSRRQLKSRAYGSSIPHLNVTHIGEVVLPRPAAADMDRIGLVGCAIADARGDAVALERDAVNVVETWIEAGGRG